MKSDISAGFKQMVAQRIFDKIFRFNGITT